MAWMAPHRFDLFSGVAPDALVAVGSAGSRTFADLFADARAVAARLPAATEGSEVLVVCGDRYHFAVGLSAAWQAGHAVALPPTSQPAMVAKLAANPAVRFLLHDTDARDGLDLRALLGTEWSTSATSPITFEPSRHVVTVYTSGSTGAPRAVRKTAAQLLGEAALMATTFEISASDRVLATVPPNHIYGLLFGVLVPLSAGAAFVRETPLHAEAVQAFGRTHGATIHVSVPAHLRALAALEVTWPALRFVFSSGAPLDATTAQQLAQRGVAATEILGSSETGGIAWRRTDSNQLWQPLPGVRVGADATGQLLLESPFLEGSLGHAQPCADRIELVPGGRFKHLGRLDDVVKVAGKRIALGELEARLRVVPGVQDAAVVTLPTVNGRGIEVCAALVAPDCTPAAIRESLLQWLDPVVLPRRWRFVKSLPREENGKLTRARLLALFDEGRRDFEVKRREDRSGESIEIREVEVGVPRDLLFFRGHFEDAPLLAGVVQLTNLAVPEIRERWPDLGVLRSLARIKFRRPIRPDETIVLLLERSEHQPSVSFQIARRGEPCSSGTLLFAVGAR